ncbi:MAG TPA: DUF2079 domain-containing protein [Anaerolineae bacterium]|nr:DUF2079 domain-containing protein [Anaerolineae bacterium]
MPPSEGSGARRWTIIAVWTLVLAYAAFFAVLTIRRHNAFQSTDFELGNLSQIAWNNLHGAPFIMTNPEGAQPENSLGIHVWPILLPVSLVYLIWADPRSLLILQAIVVALGAWPVYWLARRALAGAEAEAGAVRVGWLALVFTFAYLMFPALQAANRFDFHEITLAPTLLLMALWRLENAQWGRFAMWSGLAMACKEDVPLLVFMLGLYLLAVRRRRWPGLATMAAGAAWFWLAAGVILPHFDVAQASPLGYRYGHLGDSLGEIVLTFLTRPGTVLGYLCTGANWAYVRDLLSPMALLSLLAPEVLVLALPALLENLLSVKSQMHVLEGYQYSVTLVPFVVVSAAYGVGRLSRRLGGRRFVPYVLVALVLAATLAYHVGHGETPLAAGFEWPKVTEHHRLGAALAERIPPDAAVSALPRLFPHVSTRRYVYAVNQWDGSRLSRLEGAEYAWLDVTNFWPLHPNDLKAGVDQMLSGGFGVVEAEDGWLLLRRGGGETALPPVFFDFARVREDHPQYPMQLQFLIGEEPAVECLGFDISEGDEGWMLAFYWRALRPLPEGVRLCPFYLDDETGRILEDTTLRPMVATVWYPPSSWQPGEVIRTETLPWPVGDDFSAGLGVTLGGDWSSTEVRLPARVESSSLTLRLFEDNTWVRLVAVREGKPRPEPRTYSLPSPQYALDADLGGEVRLLGYDLERGRRSAIRVTLYWQAQQRMTTSYTAFAQLLGPDGQVAAQVDALPREGGYPTFWWLPGEVVADPLDLIPPAGAPPGTTCRLVAGLYDASTGTRLRVVGSEVDFVDLGAVEP